MDIRQTLREELTKELKHVSQKIAEEKEANRKTFFYSAAYGIVRRILNLSYDPQLDFIELVLEVTYNTINARVTSIMQGNATIPLIDVFFDKLAEYVNELALKIEKNEETYKTLEKIVVLAHVATGNGYYLYTKGLIKL